MLLVKRRLASEQPKDASAWSAPPKVVVSHELKLYVALAATENLDGELIMSIEQKED
jgi:hypothetical protein